MATIKYTDVLGATPYFHDYYDVDTLDIVSHSSSKVTFTDQNSDYRIVLKGTDITVVDGEITGGTLQSAKFINDDDAVLFNITKGDYDADDLSQALKDDGFNGFLKEFFAGNDKIVGSGLDDDLWGGVGNDKILGGAGRDYIGGGTGNDTLTGGAGPDMFLFGVGGDKDTITDFDAKGGGQKQDYIVPLDGGSYEIYKSGNDTIVDFGDGQTLTLLDVKRSDITEADFMLLA